jgi:hypothetical protein
VVDRFQRTAIAHYLQSLPIGAEGMPNSDGDPQPCTRQAQSFLKTYFLFGFQTAPKFLFEL